MKGIIFIIIFAGDLIVLGLVESRGFLFYWESKGRNAAAAVSANVSDGSFDAAN